MKKTFTFTLCALAIGSFTTKSFATDLVDVYQQALASDPTFKAANAQFLSIRENIPIARAALLPQLSITGGYNRNFADNSGNQFIGTGEDGRFAYNQGTYSLSLQQQIFNLTNWAALANAKSTVKAAEATFSFSAQDLIMRVATAYFNVLQANDILKATQEKKKAVGEQLDQATQKFKVGLTPITDVNNAEATYDTTLAQEIQNKNDLANAIENLRAITGIQYKNLNSLTTNLPLLFPDPDNINRWVTTAEQQNYNLLAAHFNSISAREGIITAQAGFTPTISAVGGYTYNHQSGPNEISGTSRDSQIGLNASLPIFSGGGTVAAVTQAEYQYQQALSVEEETHRSVTNQTRQDFLGIVSLINKIKADKQEIISKQSSLTSTLASYQAGLRTMFEVLQAETDLYTAQQTFAQDQYSYLIKTVQLKEDAGILSVSDIKNLNNWVLNKSIPVYDNSNHMLHPSGKINRQALEKNLNERPKTTPLSYSNNKTTNADETASNPQKTSSLTDNKTQPSNQPQEQKPIKSNTKERYTIELISSEDKNAVDTFVNNHPEIKDKINSSTTTDAGKTYYKVTYGDYSTLDIAQSAMNKLPKDLKQNDAMIVTKD